MFVKYFGRLHNSMYIDYILIFETHDLLKVWRLLSRTHRFVYFLLQSEFLDFESNLWFVYLYLFNFLAQRRRLHIIIMLVGIEGILLWHSKLRLVRLRLRRFLLNDFLLLLTFDLPGQIFFLYELIRRVCWLFVRLAFQFLRDQDRSLTDL